ncbi:MAG TPA: hypothetical protein VFF79_09205 [Conexibacter sp.]|jgi:hypothetical protein|nr:hypothetical protein [Conexibacter sp.]
MTALVRSPRRGLEKAVTAELEVIQANGAVAAAREATRVDSITAVAHRAMLAVDQLSTIEAALIRRRPDERAEVRLRFVADSAANAIGNVVLDLDRRL